MLKYCWGNILEGVLWKHLIADLCHFKERQYHCICSCQPRMAGKRGSSLHFHCTVAVDFSGILESEVGTKKHESVEDFKQDFYHNSRQRYLIWTKMNWLENLS